MCKSLTKKILKYKIVYSTAGADEGKNARMAAYFHFDKNLIKKID